MMDRSFHSLSHAEKVSSNGRRPRLVGAGARGNHSCRRRLSPTAPRRATSRPALDARPFPHYTELNGISNYHVTPQRTHRREGAAIPPASQWYRRYTHDTPGTFLALAKGAEPAP